MKNIDRGNNNISKGYNNEPFPSKKFQQIIADYLEHGEIEEVEDRVPDKEIEETDANNNT